MINSIWSHRWSIVALAGIWLAFECWISWAAFCNSTNPANQNAGEEYGCIFNGPVVSLIRLFYKWWMHIFDKPDAYVALFTLVLALFTLALWRSTRNLWIATRDTAKRQERDTEILQRAYIAAELGGIRRMTDRQLVGHVVFRNVGHLPATNLRDVVKKIEVQDGAWRPPKIPDTELEDHGVLPIGVSMRKGSAGTIYLDEPAASTIPDKYLYVWGRMTYDDGFNRGRYLNFCHRYPWDTKEPTTLIGTLVREEHGRYHEYGNDAD